jgi:2-C-methyl-D-erythritol 4-phosphate cytidylyltransferase
VSKNDDMSTVQDYIKNDYYDNSISFDFVGGGNERFYSVFNAMKYLKENNPPNFVFIHDGVRPLIMACEIENLKKSVYENNASILATKVIDTIKKIDDKKAIKLTIDRDYLYRAATPQAFNFELYYKAMSEYIYSFENEECKTIATDDAQIYSDYMGEVFVVDCGMKNIKITHKSDLDLFLRLR